MIARIKPKWPVLPIASREVNVIDERLRVLLSLPPLLQNARYVHVLLSFDEPRHFTLVSAKNSILVEGPSGLASSIFQTPFTGLGANKCPVHLNL